jgi:hypothetical protein
MRHGDLLARIKASIPEWNAWQIEKQYLCSRPRELGTHTSVGIRQGAVSARLNLAGGAAKYADAAARQFSARWELAGPEFLGKNEPDVGQRVIFIYRECSPEAMPFGLLRDWCFKWGAIVELYRREIVRHASPT